MAGRKRRRWKMTALCIVPAIALPAWLFSEEIPDLRPGGVQISERAALPRVGQFPIRLPREASIEVLGDSNSAGSRVGGKEYAWPAQLQKLFGNVISVSNQAVGGAIVPADPTKCAASAAPAAKPALVVIMFGTNDAAPRRWLGTHRTVPQDLFRRRLARLVETCRANGTDVLMLAAPPAGSRAMDRRIQPYRSIAREVASGKGALFIDPAEVLAGDTFLKMDGIHLNRTAQAKLAVLLHQALLPDLVA